MKNFRLVYISAFLILALSFSVQAGNGLALMKVEPGARPSGMGGAFVAVPGSPMSAVYNPALATSLDEFTATFGHHEYWENIRMESGYFATPVSGRAYLHGGIRLATVSDLEAREYATLIPDAYFDAHDVSFKAGLAYAVSDKFSAGMGFGWFFEKIEAYRGSVFNVDFGLSYQPMTNMYLGASVTNLGSDFMLTLSGEGSSREISLPTTYRVGGSYQYDRFLGALDVVVVDDEAHPHLGVEAFLHEYFSIRSGYMFSYDSKNFTAGATFRHRNISVDYAFVPYTNDLGTTHLFNFTFSI